MKTLVEMLQPLLALCLAFYGLLLIASGGPKLGNKMIGGILGRLVQAARMIMAGLARLLWALATLTFRLLFYRPR